MLASNALRALVSFGLGLEVWAGDALPGPVGLRTPALAASPRNLVVRAMPQVVT